MFFVSLFKRTHQKPSLREALGRNKVKHIVIAGDYTVQPLMLRREKEEKLQKRLELNDNKLITTRYRTGKPLRKLAKFSVDSMNFGTKLVSIFLLETPKIPNINKDTTIREEISYSGWDEKSIVLFLSFLIYYLARHNIHPLTMKHKDNKTRQNGKNSESDEHDHEKQQSVKEPRGESLIFGSVIAPELGINYNIPWKLDSLKEPNDERGFESQGIENTEDPNSPGINYYQQNDISYILDVENIRPRTVVVLTNNYTDKMTPSLEKMADYIIYLQDRRNSIDGYMDRIGKLLYRNELIPSLTIPRLIETQEDNKYNLPDRSFPIVAWPGIIPSYSKSINMPQLVIMFTRYRNVHNVPPTALLRSELLFLGELKHATSCSFAEALIKFAKTQQRNGK